MKTEKEIEEQAHALRKILGRPPTFKQASSYVRSLGGTLGRTAGREVCIRFGSRSYFTTDLDDAMRTAKSMASSMPSPAELVRAYDAVIADAHGVFSDELVDSLKVRRKKLLRKERKNET